MLPIDLLHSFLLTGSSYRRSSSTPPLSYYFQPLYPHTATPPPSALPMPEKFSNDCA
ncbi:hypothetical protein BDV38DRAFT_266360 [Aspergillus pseudotamarii]|uniref:Uncharacterized protein n=1 Tax=Aspergillus pseudotamarii TaxID=132259 RepID=A0A5N6S7W2_ASPPS|nr:uncharacterized protein BDV38DRAFT_266360 [Aspergillus pseudotamarii]KAE8130748.1 hypothetical protein BDV38DRAFT_266360 [Aspergillus pseudotamarii]